MPPVALLGAAVGLLWAATAFRILFHLWRRGSALGGTFVPGPFTFLRAIGAWRHDPAERAWRRALLLLTVGVIGLSVATFTGV